MRTPCCLAARWRLDPDGESAPSELGALIVRCHLNTATCERATEAVPGPGSNLVLPMP